MILMGRNKKWILILVTVVLVVGAIALYIENQRLNGRIDQTIEEFYNE